MFGRADVASCAFPAAPLSKPALLASSSRANYNHLWQLACRIAFPDFTRCLAISDGEAPDKRNRAPFARTPTVDKGATTQGSERSAAWTSHRKIVGGSRLRRNPTAAAILGYIVKTTFGGVSPR